ncbi:MAG: DNA repair protein RecO [Acidimicrobiales bacterium]
MSLFRDRGVVLRTFRLGEADRVVTLVTEDHGKVRAVVKGVRRTKSRFGARMEPLSHVSMLCWQGRELDVVNQAEVIDAFRPVREDLDRMRRAIAMLEAVDQVAQEGEANPELYRMLVGALRTMSEHDSPLIVASFFLKLLALDGSGPVLDNCARCGRSDELASFDLGEGGVLCRSCRRGSAMSPEALGLMRRILGGELGRVLAEPPGPGAAQVEHLAQEALEYHLERRIKSLRLIDRS